MERHLPFTHDPEIEEPRPHYIKLNEYKNPPSDVKVYDSEGHLKYVTPPTYWETVRKTRIY